MKKAETHGTSPLPPHPNMQASAHKVPKSASQVVPSRVPLTLHAIRRSRHGASRLVHAISAWSVKTRRAPPRHRMEARAYGHTTTSMPETSTRPPTPFPLPQPPPPKQGNANKHKHARRRREDASGGGGRTHLLLASVILPLITHPDRGGARFLLP